MPIIANLAEPPGPQGFETKIDIALRISLPPRVGAEELDTQDSAAADGYRFRDPPDDRGSVNHARHHPRPGGRGFPRVPVIGMGGRKPGWDVAGYLDEARAERGLPPVLGEEDSRKMRPAAGIGGGRGPLPLVGPSGSRGGVTCGPRPAWRPSPPPRSQDFPDREALIREKRNATFLLGKRGMILREALKETGALAGRWHVIPRGGRITVAALRRGGWLFPASLSISRRRRRYARTRI